MGSVWEKSSKYRQRMREKKLLYLEILRADFVYIPDLGVQLSHLFLCEYTFVS